MSTKQEEHWSAEAYQNSASFVPKLATEVIGWLDVKEDDVILDVGCGDGIINLAVAKTLARGTGRIHGIDSSPAMISSARKAAADAGIANVCTFEGESPCPLVGDRILMSEVLDAATQIGTVEAASYDKVFSNAAMHWILRPEPTRKDFFAGVKSALKPTGTFVFEMGGMGNVAEMRTVFLAVISKRIGIHAARQADPWFFPDERWMTNMLENEVGGFKIEKIEREYRPTPADKGGVEGWVKLMGKQFFDVIEDNGERQRCVSEACQILETVCRSPGGGDWFGYVRLRAVARRI